VTPQVFTFIRRLGRLSLTQVRAVCELLWAERALNNAGLTRWFPDMRELAVALGYKICPVVQLSEVAIYVGGTIYYRAGLSGTDLQFAVAHELAHALLDDYCADEYLHSDVQALTLALFFTRDHMRHFANRGGLNEAVKAGSRRCRSWIIRFRWVLMRTNPAIAA
jgi:hypothetical protein